MPINDFSHHQLSWYPDKKRLHRPLYKMLAQLKQAIDHGRLSPGTQLPPQRELADYLDVNFTTITRTYKLSAQLGLTYGIHGKGTFVSPNGIDPLTVKSPAQRIIDLGFTASFEQTNFLLDDIIAKVIKQGAARLLTYDSPTGRAVDKQALIRYLAWLGISLHPAQRVLVTAGGENSLTLILLTLFSSGDRIAVDQFTYANFIATAQLNNIHLVAIKDDEAGMVPAALRQACQDGTIDGLYLMPEYSNPTGCTLPAGRRRQLAKIAQEFRLTVIEDDYMSFLSCYNPHRPRKMMQLLPDQTCYICSMSKVVASGLRVGYLVYPQRLASQLENGFFNTTVKTTTLNTAIVTETINSQLIYQIIDRKLALARTANQLFEQFFPTAPRGPLTSEAFFRCLPLKAASFKPLEAGLRQHGLRCFAAQRFQTTAHVTDNFLRVSLSATSSMEELKTGLRQLQRYLVSRQLI